MHHKYKRDYAAIRQVCPSAFIRRRNYTPNSIVGKVRFYHKTLPVSELQTPPVCWYCTEPITGSVFQCPRSFQEKYNTYIVEGYFCSYACVKSYAIERIHDHEGNLAALNVDRIARKLGHKDPIGRSPHWSCLQKFGGYMTIDEFRACGAQDIPTTLPPATRTIVGGFCHYLFDSTDPVEPYDKLHDKLAVPAPAADSDWAQVPIVHDKAVTRSHVSVFTSKPVSVTSAKFQKTMKINQTNYALSRNKSENTAAAKNIKNLMGIVQIPASNSKKGRSATTVKK